jgi:isocitrate dehydrogenase (NAD+)
MLDHVSLADQATRLRAAALRTLQDNVRTRDLGGEASTKDFTSAIVARLGDQGS